jgi:homoserine O-acetyltransferase
MIEYFNLGSYHLQSGQILHNAKLAYKTYGSLNEAKTNVILYPTWFSGFISDNEWLIGSDKALNPDKYFIIVPCLLGNGQSTSPNSSLNSDNRDFIKISLTDNVMAQHKLITEKWDITSIQLVLGWSMGAQQTYLWAALYPQMVKRAMPFAGSARTSPHNFVFLESLRNVLIQEGLNREEKLRLFARIYAGWGFSQPFYKKECWRQLGFKSLEDFLVGFWEAFFLKREPTNLATLLWTWQYGDISNNTMFDNNFVLAMSSITARVLILAPEIDLYFPKEDNMDESVLIRNSNLIIIPGVWGHFAGGGINNEDTLFINGCIHKLLQYDDLDTEN